MITTGTESSDVSSDISLNAFGLSLLSRKDYGLKRCINRMYGNELRVMIDFVTITTFSYVLVSMLALTCVDEKIVTNL